MESMINNRSKTKKDMSRFTIREAQLTDMFEIRRIKHDGFIEEMVKYHQDPEFFISPQGYAREIQYLENKEGCFHSFVVLEDERIVGGCTITDEGKDIYYVNVIYVESKYQDAGVGSLLLPYVMDQFPNAKLWHLETPYQSYRNHHFYEKFGFVKVGETEPDQNGFILFEYEKKVS